MRSIPKTFSELFAFWMHGSKEMTNGNSSYPSVICHSKGNCRSNATASASDTATGKYFGNHLNRISKMMIKLCSHFVWKSIKMWQLFTYSCIMSTRIQKIKTATKRYHLKRNCCTEQIVIHDTFVDFVIIKSKTYQTNGRVEPYQMKYWDAHCTTEFMHVLGLFYSDASYSGQKFGIFQSLKW